MNEDADLSFGSWSSKRFQFLSEWFSSNSEAGRFCLATLNDQLTFLTTNREFILMLVSESRKERVRALDERTDEWIRQGQRRQSTPYSSSSSSRSTSIFALKTCTLVPEGNPSHPTPPKPTTVREDHREHRTCRAVHRQRFFVASRIRPTESIVQSIPW